MYFKKAHSLKNILIQNQILSKFTGFSLIQNQIRSSFDPNSKEKKDQILHLVIDFSIFRTHRNWVRNFPKRSPPGGQQMPPIKSNQCSWQQLQII